MKEREKILNTKQTKKSTAGITLIALVVTIVVLLILATISITMVFGERGLIARAEESKHTMNISDYTERTKLVVLDEYTGKKVESKKESLKELVKINLKAQEDWVLAVEDGVEAENELIVYTTDGYRIKAVIPESGNVNVSGETYEGEPYPRIQITRLELEGTENEKIRLQVTASLDKITEKTTKIEKIKLIEPAGQAVEKAYVDGGVVFEVEGNGKYVFEAITDGGKSNTKAIIVDIEELASQIMITAEPTSARNTESIGTQNGVATGPIKVIINYGETELKKEYKIGTEGSWTKVEEGIKEIEVTENTEIYARYYEEGVGARGTVIGNIQNVDNVDPNSFTISLENNITVTTNSIEVKNVITEDEASEGAASGIAGIEKYKYRIYDGTTWGSWQDSNVFNNLLTGTYKIEVKAIDKAGNEKVSSNTVEVILRTILVDDITIKAEPTSARNTESTGTQNEVETGPISVTIEYGNSKYTRQYKKSTDSKWTTVEGNSVTFTVTENIDIFARYYDGTNGFSTEATNIQNVDNVDPTISSYNATVEGATITATMTATDEASEGAAASGIAGIKETKYSIDGTNYQTENTFTVTEAKTYTIYFKAIDNAGNEKVETKQVTVANSTVTYDANGGTGAPSAHSTITNTNITLSSTAPTKTGYTFAGWSTSSTATSATYSKGQTIKLTANTKLYAVWTAKTVEVTFMRNTSATDTTQATQTFTYGKTGQSFSTKGWTRTGYTLLGWSEDKNATTQKYGVTSGVTDNWINTNSPSITIHAIWKANTYTVVYNGNGNTGGSTASSSHTYGTAKALTANGFTRTGYTFLGWSTSNTATSATYTDKKSVSNLTATANGTVNLYAVWKLNNTTPGKPTTTVTSRNTNSFVVNTKATDSDGDKLTYKLYVKKSSENSYSLAATSASTASGTAVNLTASSLSGYTVYNYYVTVVDTKSATATSATGTTGTGCAGTGKTCSGPFSETKTCYGGTSCSGPFSETKTCYGGTICSGPFTKTCGKSVLVSTPTAGVCRLCGASWNLSTSRCSKSSCSGGSGYTPTSYKGTCSSCGTTNTSGSAGNKTCSGKVSTTCSHGNSSSHYYCSTHSKNCGSSSSHTYSQSKACGHGNYSSHYYCSTHSTNCGSSSSHTYSATKACDHGKTATHSYCSHGKTTTHYPN